MIFNSFNIQELVTQKMEIKITNFENTRYKNRNEIFKIKNDDELYLDYDYVTSSGSDEYFY